METKQSRKQNISEFMTDGKWQYRNKTIEAFV